MSTEVRNWDVVAKAMEAAGATSSEMYVRAKALAEGKLDPMPTSFPQAPYSISAVAGWSFFKIKPHRSEASFKKIMSDTTQSRFGFVLFAETWNGRLAMLGFVIGLGTELLTGQGILSQIGLWTDQFSYQVFKLRKRGKTSARVLPIFFNNLNLIQFEL